MRKYSCRNLEDRQPGSDSGFAPKQGDADVWSGVGWGNNVYVYFHTDGMPLYNSFVIAFMFTCTQIGCHYTKALMFTCTQI